MSKSQPRSAAEKGPSPSGDLQQELNMGLFKEFREFAVKGNVIDMAVGIIIGAAFTMIVNSLVNDVIMPPIGLVTGGVDFSDKQMVLKDAVVAAEGVKAKPAVILKYGVFINAV